MVGYDGVVKLAIALYMAAYIFVPALKELINGSVGLTGSNLTLTGTVLPLLAVVALVMLIMPKRD